MLLDHGLQADGAGVLGAVVVEGGGADRSDTVWRDALGLAQFRGPDDAIVAAELSDRVFGDPRDRVLQERIAETHPDVPANLHVPAPVEIGGIPSQQSLRRLVERPVENRPHEIIVEGFVDIGVATEISEIGQAGGLNRRVGRSWILRVAQFGTDFGQGLGVVLLKEFHELLPDVARCH